MIVFGPFIKTDQFGRKVIEMGISFEDMSNLDRIVAREVAEYERNRAKLFLEASIGALLRAYSIAEVAKILREQADHLNEFG